MRRYHHILSEALSRIAEDEYDDLDDGDEFGHTVKARETVNGHDVVIKYDEANDNAYLVIDGSEEYDPRLLKDIALTLDIDAADEIEACREFAEMQLHLSQELLRNAVPNSLNAREYADAASQWQRHINGEEYVYEACEIAIIETLLPDL